MVIPVAGTSTTEPTASRNPVAPLPSATPSRSLAEALGFFRAWLRDPWRVAAITPSGRALAELITSGLSERTGPVIELGPGTGAFTRALLKRGVKPEDLVLVEAEPGFAEALRLRFPAVRTLQMDAARLRTQAPFGERTVGAVVSGLPVLSMSPGQVLAILKGSFGRMTPGGAFHQFTYGPRCPVRPEILERLGLEATRIGRTLANVPPAAVYHIRRRSDPVLPVASASQGEAAGHGALLGQGPAP
ncbi:class I SAM-dependent methyltransferase [Aureimonas jatrophae]|uniref:Phospholipid N-methyltransferase n=1 Tax=Aureimonas jatrophae TaxID=1166073 RepID=A0A1H0DFW2_9HYPH|nr:methyltransferase domain-containing protein [Aureimonas jatrophae]MBB3951872.1 phospholipid N-methyltransferase [Aureimonas jatrophae]SDN69060.1 Phospholipid N-methyltransferase [Aureimonas jatrophae]